MIKIKSCNFNLKISRLNQEFNSDAKELKWVIMEGQNPTLQESTVWTDSLVIGFSEYLTELSSYMIGEEFVCCFCRENQLHGRVSQLSGAGSLVN
jgi:hypothetical protein